MTNPQTCGGCGIFILDAKQAILGNPTDYWACSKCVDKHVRQVESHKRRWRGTVVEDE